MSDSATSSATTDSSSSSTSCSIPPGTRAVRAAPQWRALPRIRPCSTSSPAAAPRSPPSPRAPLSKLVAYREAKGWSFPWVSSAGGDFNLDFHVTLDPDLAPNSYNFRDGDELIAADQEWLTTYRGERPGISTFLRDGDDVFHTYSVYARGLEVMMPAYGMLDLTALGRQESWEEPAGRAPAFYRHDAGVLNPEVVDA